MNEDACVLSGAERQIVEMQVAETCSHRGWTLYGTNVRSNHMHLVIGAIDTHPEKVRIDVKAWCTRRLKERSDPHRENWWAERGSQRYVWDENSLATVLDYVTEAQDRKQRDRC